jgi:hypothetical protein
VCFGTINHTHIGITSKKILCFYAKIIFIKSNIFTRTHPCARSIQSTHILVLILEIKYYIPVFSLVPLKFSDIFYAFLFSPVLGTDPLISFSFRRSPNKSELLFMHFSQAHCYFFPLRSQYALSTLYSDTLI